MVSDFEEQRQVGYAAVWASGWLSSDVYVNARIWRCVDAALKAALPDKPADS